MKADGSTQAAGHAELFGLCVFLHLTFFSVSFAGLSSLPSVNSALGLLFMLYFHGRLSYSYI